MRAGAECQMRDAQTLPIGKAAKDSRRLGMGNLIQATAQLGIGERRIRSATG